LIFTVSDAVAKGLSACGIPADRIRISGNGISPVAFALKGGEKEYDAVFMGRIEVAKGIIDLIKAWALLCHGNPRLRLAIIGSAVKPMQKKLNKLITRFHIEGNVLFLGCIQGSEKFNLLAKSRIFISPSYDESFGQSVMEAVACGLPVVAYDLDIYRKLYPEGLLHTVSPADTKALAEEIAFVLSNQSFCDEAAGRGRDSVRVCEWGAIMSRELEEIGALEKPKV
jgi:glycosyltransferase involved in cell wall biosynthesis